MVWVVPAEETEDGDVERAADPVDAIEPADRSIGFEFDLGKFGNMQHDVQLDDDRPDEDEEDESEDTEEDEEQSPVWIVGMTVRIDVVFVDVIVWFDRFWFDIFVLLEFELINGESSIKANVFFNSSKAK